MDFSSAQNRRLWSSVLYATIFDIVVVLAIASLAGVDRDFWVLVFFGVLAMWIAQITISLKNAAFSHIYFVFIDKKRRVETVFGELVKCKVPKYEEDFFPSPDFYLGKVLKERDILSYPQKIGQ
ncbi:hypothetical protein [Pannonibacter carbonis]|uniref:hypothetical protein n=1 Tax=Pannonibacter carbonis TaxID=2067569 RepID=UPI000D0F734E|nr:hypothetical protein [Pannonibacter carbonis]